MRKVSRKPVKILRNQKLDNPYKVGQKFIRMAEKFAEEHDDVLRELAKR